VRHLAALPACLGPALLVRKQAAAAAATGGAVAAGARDDPGSSSAASADTSSEENGHARMHDMLLRLARMQQERTLTATDIAAVVLHQHSEPRNDSVPAAATAAAVAAETEGPLARLFDAGDGGSIELLFEPAGS